MTARTLVLFALVLTVLSTGSFAEEEPEWGFTALDKVKLGEQLTGKRVSHYDLRGRVVLLYQWGITCPISTGAFPAVNRLVKKYRDFGIAVLGFQVRRNPDVLAENVMQYVNHLRPEFPIFRLGDDWEWPEKILPWCHIYGTDGRLLYTGHLRGIDARLDEILAQAPDWLFGGPYEQIADAVANLVADRDHAGVHLRAVRGLAREKGRKGEEAKALLAFVARWVGWQLAKADEDCRGPVEKAAVYSKLATMFESDPLGERPAKLLKEITSADGFEAEMRALEALGVVRSVFRTLPPAGRYLYDMTYVPATDESVLAARSRMIAEFRAGLERLRNVHPKTYAASVAEDLLFVNDPPFLEEPAARTRLSGAKALLATATTPAEQYDAYLLLTEIEGGYFGEDGITAKTAELLKTLRTTPKSTLLSDGRIHRRLNAKEADIRELVARGGSALPEPKATVLIEEMAATAKRAGPRSRLAKRAAAWIEDLERSYSGPASLGVVFDQRWNREGARLRWVYPLSAADACGLRAGDVLTTLDGAKIENAAGLEILIDGKRPGDKAEISFRRGSDEEKTIKVALGRVL